MAEALWRVVTTKGVGAVSVRTVAQEAGVVVGSLRHVFPSRAELLQFSAELMEARVAERVLAVPEDRDHRHFALAVLKELLPLTAESRAEMQVNLALIAEAPAVPELAIVRDHAHQRLADLCSRLVEMLREGSGEGSSTQHAQRLHALIDGLALHLLHSTSSDTEWAVTIVEAELAEIIERQ